MRTRAWHGVLVAALLLCTGCSDVGGLVTRYRAERMLWQARRAEERLRAGKAAPDSATLLRIRGEYSKLRATLKPPFAPGSGAAARRIDREISRLVAGAELQGAGMALQAGRPDLALEQARWAASIAGEDPALRRDADFLVAGALATLKKPDEAIALLYAMMDRYPPAPPQSYEREDPILSVPDRIIGLRALMGDAAGAQRDRARAVEYYRRIVSTAPPVLLEAQARARATHQLVQLGKANEAYTEVAALRRLVTSTPELKGLQPEILYSEARIRSMGGDIDAALDLYDLVVMVHPGSRFASKALFDSGVLLEKSKDLNGAFFRYRAAYNRPNPDAEGAPIAAYRSAMVKDRMGEWEEAKGILEAIPVQFPRSDAAVEALFAVVSHYERSGQPAAARAGLLKAVDVYRGLIARDSTSAYCAEYRWGILRAHVGLKGWKDALATIDEIARKDAGTVPAARALAEGARISRALGDKARSDMYLRKLSEDYPTTPIGAQAREALREGAGREKKTRM